MFCQRFESREYRIEWCRVIQIFRYTLLLLLFGGGNSRRLGKADDWKLPMELRHFQPCNFGLRYHISSHTTLHVSKWEVSELLTGIGSRSSRWKVKVPFWVI